MKLTRSLLYVWALPTTLLGLLFVPLAIATRGKIRIVDGVLELSGGAVRFVLENFTFLKGGASAMTLGHVVLGRDAQTLDLTRDHERVHVRQCEKWGPFFLPAYLIASLVALLRGKNPYRDNAFERQAYGS